MYDPRVNVFDEKMKSVTWRAKPRRRFRWRTMKFEMGFWWYLADQNAEVTITEWFWLND